MKKKIAILGSTGSIGTNTIDVLMSNKKNFFSLKLDFILKYFKNKSHNRY